MASTTPPLVRVDQDESRYIIGRHACSSRYPLEGVSLRRVTSRIVSFAKDRFAQTRGSA